MKSIKILSPLCLTGCLLFSLNVQASCTYFDTNGDHNWEQGGFEYATCEEDGYYDQSCLDCGYTERYPIYAYGHDWVMMDIVESTCDSQGYDVYECRYCELTTDSLIDPAGHSYGGGIVTTEETEKDLETWKEDVEQLYQTYLANAEPSLDPELLLRDWSDLSVPLDDTGYAQCGLTLKAGGIAEYGYGPAEYGFDNMYQGNWWYVPYENESERGTVFLDLTKLVSESTGDGPERIIGEYFFSEPYWDGTNEVVYATRQMGDELVPENYYGFYTFIESVG